MDTDARGRGAPAAPGRPGRSVSGAARLLWGLLLYALALPCAALNQRLYPLAELVRDSDAIVLGRAIAVDSVRMRAALRVERPLKGQVTYQWVALDVAPGGWGHPQQLIRRLTPGLPLVLFAARVRGRHVVLGYTNGTWFQMTAADGPDPDRLSWNFTRCEVFLRRTFRGETPELVQVLRDVLAGRREAPAPNPAAGPGMGPEAPAAAPAETALPALPGFVAAALAQPRSAEPARGVPVRPLGPEEQQWVDAAARQFRRSPQETANLLAQADYVVRDAQRALEYERDHGTGGNRAWVRSAQEILALRQRSDRLSWLDVRGVLTRAGELFTPVTDPVELIHGLRTRFTWDELDPLFDDDKWGRRRLADEIEKREAARSAHPLWPGDELGDVLLEAGFGRAGSGEPAMETVGWKPLPGRSWDLARRQFDWPGGESGSQRPGAAPFAAPGSRANPLPNLPPPPGLPLSRAAGVYSGGSLRFAVGVGDYEGRGRGAEGALAHYDRSSVRVRPGESRSFLITAQVYVPDHTDMVGEPRAGWFYIRRPSRSIDAGIRIVDAVTGTVSLVPDEALLLKLEPALDRFDRVLLRVDVTAGDEDGGRGRVRLAAFTDGIGEVAHVTTDLGRAPRGIAPAPGTGDTGIALAPVFGTRRPADGYVPEFYLASVQVRAINDGGVGAAP